VLTGRDAEADGIGPLPTLVDVPGRDGPLFDPERADNTVVLWDSGRFKETEAAFAQAHRVVSVELVNNRMVGNPMEPRVALGGWNAAAGRYVFHGPSQGAHRVRDNLARHALKVPPEMLRVVSPDVGGGFGVRGKLMPEKAMVLWAARRLGWPVKWLAGRTETFQSDPHGRNQVARAEWRWMRRPAAWASASVPSPEWGPICRIWGRACRPRAGNGHVARSMTRRPSTTRCAASSPTPCLPTASAAPGAPKPPIPWSASSTRPARFRHRSRQGAAPQLSPP
jgi:hypothetical protein